MFSEPQVVLLCVYILLRLHDAALFLEAKKHLVPKLVLSSCAGGATKHLGLLLWLSGVIFSFMAPRAHISDWLQAPAKKKCS